MFFSVKHCNFHNLVSWQAHHWDRCTEGHSSSTLRPSHTTTETIKKSLLSIHTTTFFTTAKIFSTVLNMGNDFHDDFLGKIVVKIVGACEGLRSVSTCLILNFQGHEKEMPCPLMVITLKLYSFQMSHFFNINFSTPIPTKIA